ncbi:MAG: ribose 5-phosphate isomerase A [Planctomycetota bacterium]
MSVPPSSKQAAGLEAARLVDDGMKLGLGTGSTVAFFLEGLAARIREEGLSVVGVPTSEDTADRCRELGIPLTDLESTPELDLAVDGADEVDPAFSLVKGGGGALLREKIVAAAAGRVAIIVGGNKMVERLGSTFMLPIEIVPFGSTATRGRVAASGGCSAYLRLTEGGEPFVTDNGNYILDCRFEEGITDPPAMHAALSQVPGVVAVGIFLDLCDLVIEGRDDGTTTTHQRP